MKENCIVNKDIEDWRIAFKKVDHEEFTELANIYVFNISKFDMR